VFSLCINKLLTEEVYCLDLGQAQGIVSEAIPFLYVTVSPVAILDGRCLVE